MPGIFDNLERWTKEVIKRDNVLFSDYDATNQINKCYVIYRYYYPRELKELHKQGITELTKSEKEAYDTTLLSVMQNFKDTLKISPQHHEDVVQALGDVEDPEFSYYIDYLHNNDIKTALGHSRITLSLDFRKSPQAIKAISEFLHENINNPIGKAIKSTKILGKAHQAKTTDNAILYLNTSDMKIVREIMYGLTKKLKANNVDVTKELFDHAPLGMESIMKGFSFAHEAPQGSSLGRARSEVIADAVNKYFEDEGAISVGDALRQALKEAGYNPEEPAELDIVNYLENFEKIEKDIVEKRKKLLGVWEDNQQILNEINEQTVREKYQFEKNWILYMKNKMGDYGDRNTIIRRAMEKAAIDRLQTLFGYNKVTKKVSIALKRYVQNKVKEVEEKEKLEHYKESVDMEGLEAEFVEALENDDEKKAREITIARRSVKIDIENFESSIQQLRDKQQRFKTFIQEMKDSGEAKVLYAMEKGSDENDLINIFEDDLIAPKVDKEVESRPIISNLQLSVRKQEQEEIFDDTDGLQIVTKKNKFDDSNKQLTVATKSEQKKVKKRKK